ncbi:MAG: hypothetical protein KAJ78_09165 [Acidobacteria bacterium]|nr:hypothetical protein [Acidobacteriota bacterium]
MGLAALLWITAIVTTVILVVLTDAPIGAKLTASAICVATLLVPRFFPSLSILTGPVQAGLSIAIFLYLKFHRLVE